MVHCPHLKLSPKRDANQGRICTLDIYKEIDLADCPCCGGGGLLEEENGWCWYVMCLDCGAQTASVQYQGEEDRFEAAKNAAMLWNMRKVLRPDPGE